MTVTLQGNSPAALTAGILLLSRARSFGHRLDVEIVGDPDDLTPVEGPAIVYSAVLASCGIGRKLGSGALVIVPGPSAAPLAASLSDGGVGRWFFIDRSGAGGHACTQAFVRMCRDRDLETRDLARRLRRALAALGSAAEPAVLDLLFDAPAPPLVRVALALRAGRAISGSTTGGLTRYLAQDVTDLPDPLAPDLDRAGLEAACDDGRASAVLGRLALRLHDPVEEWLRDAREAAHRDPAYGDLAAHLVGMGSHVGTLPANAMLPPLDAPADGIAVGLAAALGATEGPADANRTLQETFRFLGGRFTPSAKHALPVESSAPPDGRLARWDWFCASTRSAAAAADTLWRRVVDPDQ